LILAHTHTHHTANYFKTQRAAELTSSLGCQVTALTSCEWSFNTAATSYSSSSSAERERERERAEEKERERERERQKASERREGGQGRIKETERSEGDKMGSAKQEERQRRGERDMQRNRDRETKRERETLRDDVCTFPDPHSLVAATSGKQLARRRPRTALDLILVSLQRGDAGKLCHEEGRQCAV
jgi:hypothetical protein